MKSTLSNKPLHLSCQTMASLVAEAGHNAKPDQLAVGHYLDALKHMSEAFRSLQQAEEVQSQTIHKETK